MEGIPEWRREKQKSAERDGKSPETVNAAVGVKVGNTGESSLSSIMATGACPMDCTENNDTPYRKNFQFLSGENNISWNTESCFQNSAHYITSNPLSRNLFGLTPAHSSRDDFHEHGELQHVPCINYHGDVYVARDPQHMPCIKYHGNDHVARDLVSLSTGHLDWLWSEEPERQQFVACSSTGMVAESNDSVEMGSRHELYHQMGEVLSPGDRVKTNNRQSWKDPGKSGLGAWAGVAGADSPRCSSMSLTDLVETASPKEVPRALFHWERSNLASHLQLAVCALPGQFHNELPKETDTDSVWAVSPVHSSLSSNSMSKRDSAGLKSELRGLSISEPTPYGTMHGLLHCTVRDGLPNYTFLLDDYDEVVTAKMWMEDIILGEEQGAWRYTFYSLRGDSKKKGKSGWKHWRRKEKLGSVLVGKMEVSSVLCSEPGHDGKVNMYVESEFVLSRVRAQEPSTLAQADFSSKTSSSLETGLHGCSKSNYTAINTSSSPSQSQESSSDGRHSDVFSPGAVSAWYVSQSLIPSSLASPNIVTKGRQKSWKWSLHSGFSSMRMSKSKSNRRSQQSSSLSASYSNLNTEDSSSDVILSQNQPHSELAGMIISVPLERQVRQVSAEIMSKRGLDMNHGIINQTWELGLEEHRIWDEATECEIHGHGDNIHHMKHKVQQYRQANITVILPSGNHGRPLSNSKGPSPLIKRWKEGGKCDCKGWDLGCGLMVLCNQQPDTQGIESKASNLREHQGKGKPLTLYKQDTDQEEAYLSLAPQENGLIALDFRAPLSPLQAFAMAVAILHGRESGVPDVDTSHIMLTAGNPDVYVQEKNSLNQNCPVVEEDVDGPSLGFTNWREDKGKRIAGQMQSSTFSNEDMSPVNVRLGGARVKVQGSDVLNCASELALSFERV